MLAMNQQAASSQVSLTASMAKRIDIWRRRKARGGIDLTRRNAVEILLDEALRVAGISEEPEAEDGVH